MQILARAHCGRGTLIEARLGLAAEHPDSDRDTAPVIFLSLLSERRQ